MAHELLNNLNSAIDWHPREAVHDGPIEDGWLDATKVMKAVHITLPGNESDHSPWERLQMANRALPLTVTRETLQDETRITIRRESHWAGIYQLHFPTEGWWYPSQQSDIESDGESFFLTGGVEDKMHILLHLDPSITTSLYLKQSVLIQTRTPYFTLWHEWDHIQPMITVCGYATKTSGIVAVHATPEDVAIRVEESHSIVTIPGWLTEEMLISNLFFPFRPQGDGYDIFGITTSPMSDTALA